MSYASYYIYNNIHHHFVYYKSNYVQNYKCAVVSNYHQVHNEDYVIHVLLVNACAHVRNHYRNIVHHYYTDIYLYYILGHHRAKYLRHAVY